MPDRNRFFLILCGASLLGGCSASSLEARHQTAVQIASNGSFQEQVIPAGIFNLTTWQRIGSPGAPANLYIEGDGLAWLSRHMKSLNPTPPDPLALHLAALDPAANVIYMARPCQYTGWNKAGPCPDYYWTGGRTAPEVTEAYKQAFDRLTAEHHLTGFHLVGYSGGAAVAVLAAENRTDILSLRTVAGNTDYAAMSALHDISPLQGSRNPAEAAPALAQLPQIHFTGSADETVTGAIFDKWRQASGASACIRHVIVSGATHEKGWQEKWPELLKAEPVCTP